MEQVVNKAHGCVQGGDAVRVHCQLAEPHCCADSQKRRACAAAGEVIKVILMVFCVSFMQSLVALALPLPPFVHAGHR